MTDSIPSYEGGRIVKNPLILAGKPTVKGTRISVELVAGLVEGGAWSQEDILRSYPRLTPEDIEACIRYAATGEPLSFITWEEFEAQLDGKGPPAATKSRPPAPGKETTPQQGDAKMSDNIPSYEGGRIVKNPLILAGKPTVKGTRISVELVVELVEGGAHSQEDILRSYPRLTPEDIEACIRYAATGEPLSFITWEEFEAQLDGKGPPAATKSRPPTPGKETTPQQGDAKMSDNIPSYEGGRIVKNPLILAGKPTVKGTRISVELVVELVEGGAWSQEDILRSYPRLTPEDIEACIRYAATGEPLSFITWEEFEAQLDGKPPPAAGEKGQQAAAP